MIRVGMNIKKTVTLSDVAKECGFSRSMVSYVLREPATCHSIPSTKEKIMEAAARLGYRLNLGAKALRSGKTYTIGILMPNYSGFCFELVKQLEAALAKSKYYGLISLWEADDTKKFFQSYERILKHGIDGIITCHYDPVLERENIPIVCYGNPRRGVDSVYPDKFQYVKDCLDYLVSMGHSKIGFLGYPADVRAEAIRRQIAERGLPLREDWFYYGFGTIPCGIEGMRRIMSLPAPERPTALIFHSDDMAFGALHAAHSMGINIPDDISIIGYDNLPESEFYSPPLTTFDQKFDIAAEKLVETIIRRIDNPGIKKQESSIRMPLIERASVRRLS